MSSKRVSGLLGKTLAHSISPLLHAALGDDDYRLFEVDESRVDEFLRLGEWDCLNVTVPYKEVALGYADVLSDCAKDCRAVNVLIRSNGRIYGDNTDFIGFLDLARGFDFADKKVCILGGGGAAKMASAACKSRGAREVITVTRSGKVRLDDTEQYADSDVLINATPVGMFPHGDQTPVKLAVFSRLLLVLDLVANPLHTRLCREAEALGIEARGGLRMLCTQAHAAQRLFCRREPSLSCDELYRFAKRQTENIALIGMPGCGKSTFGALLAERLGRTLIDTDELIETREACSISELFATRTEAYFRAVESDVLAEVSQKSGIVLATGGGAPLSEENRRCLRQNAFVIHLDCPLYELATEARPLSQSTPLDKLYEARKDAYAKARDVLFEFSKKDRCAIEALLNLIETHWEEV